MTLNPLSPRAVPAAPNTLVALTVLCAGGLLLASTPAQAQDTARVIASVPVVQHVSVPRQVCTTQQVMVEQPRSGAGALLGAVAGGAVGNAIGDGSGRAAATALGLIGGALLGNRIEGSPGTRLQEQTTCTTQNVQEQRVIGYSVTYEYAGRQYQVQMPQDPGPTIRVQVTPVMPAPPAQAPLSRQGSGVQYPSDTPLVVYSTGPVAVHRLALAPPATAVHPHWTVHGTYVHPGHGGWHPTHPHRHWR